MDYIPQFLAKSQHLSGFWAQGLMFRDAQYMMSLTSIAPLQMVQSRVGGKPLRDLNAANMLNMSYSLNS